MADPIKRAADRRREAAEKLGERDGDAAYQQYRSQVPGLGPNRPSVTMPQQLRAEPEKRNGVEMIHTWGFFTTYDRPYPMWDEQGPYKEVIDGGAGAETLGASPDVAYLVNHKGVTMARTRARTRDATLLLVEKPQGGWHDAWLNPERQDVRDYASAVKDELVTEMSFCFMIPDGKGQWASDFTTFHIRAYDIDRGDVSGVNYGANPFTDVAARSSDVLRDLEHLPKGARQEALARLGGDELTRLYHSGGLIRSVSYPDGVTSAQALEDTIRADREVVVLNRSAPTDAKMSAHERRWQNEVRRTAERYAELAAETGLPLSALSKAKLPWYEVRGKRTVTSASGEKAKTETDVLVYAEIGGKLGANAEDFAMTLAGIDSDVINLRINSPGGNVTEAMAMRSSLLHHPAWVRSIVDGIAASAATVLALGGDEIITMEGAQWMMHDASVHADGNEAELASLSKWIGRQSGNIADLYAKRMGLTSEQARQMMLDETWAFADESVELGLADRVEGQAARPLPEGSEERIRRTFDMSHRRYAGRSAAPDPLQRRDQVTGRQTRSADTPPAAPADSDPVATPAEPGGRSIQHIRALLDLED